MDRTREKKGKKRKRVSRKTIIGKEEEGEKIRRESQAKKKGKEGD